MLIETLAKLAHDAGADRISLEIPASDGAECAVMIVASFGQNADASLDDRQGRILAVLSQPLVVEGHPGELDERVVRLIDDLEGDLVSAAKALPETKAQQRRRELSETARQEDAPKGDQGADRQDGAAGGDGGSPSDKDHAQALALGEADSL